MLQEMGYDSDPVKAWKSRQKVGRPTVKEGVFVGPLYCEW